MNPTYTMAANEGFVKAIVSFYQDDSDKVFLTIYVPLDPMSLKV